MSDRPCSGVSLSGPLRGTEGGTRARSGPEQERPVCLAFRRARDRAYEPMVKSFGGQRESEGVVVPPIGVQHNAPGGKGPHFDHAHGVGKRQGMTGAARSNNPGRPSPAVPGGAADVPGGRAGPEGARTSTCSYGLRPSSLRCGVSTPCMTVFTGVTSRGRRGSGSRRTRGAAGVDRVTLALVEEFGVERMLGELRDDLRRGRYRPAPARRVDIPKPQGGKRPLGIPTVRDRVAQQAAKIVLEPIFEADFLPCSYGSPAEAVGDAGDGTAPGRVHRGVHMSWSSISGTSSARSAMNGCSPRWQAGCRIVGCSSCCGCGCKRG